MPYSPECRIIVALTHAFILFLLLGCASPRGASPKAAPLTTSTTELYWFVPDGLRADPDVFAVYRWAEEGQLPNIRRMMREGSYGYSIPVFPSHTPVNFATLFTGVLPKRHGVADGPLHPAGYPLKTVAQTGFSSLAKTIEPFWFTLERHGKKVTLLSVPGSTPPELESGQVVKGRWGGWGAEFPAQILHDASDADLQKQIGRDDKVFRVGATLTSFVAADESPPPAPLLAPSPAGRFVAFNTYGAKWGVWLDGENAFVTIDRKTWGFSLAKDRWSAWFPLTLTARDAKFPTVAKLKVIRAGPKFRLRVLFDGLNETLVTPPELYPRLHRAAGPMVDFVDNFPPQLIYDPADEATFLEESAMSFDWHERAERFFLERSRQDVFVQSIYSPNQMLTSRWWMGALDPRAGAYASFTPERRAAKWRDVLAMYKRVDAMLGEALDRRAPDAYVVLSSDHGAVPLNFEVRLNQLFLARGWLALGPGGIDWARTRVVFLNMNHVFINPAGLAGDYRPARGRPYEKLRREVTEALVELADAQGHKPLSGIYRREDVAAWGLPGERVGDLVISNETGFGWSEDVGADGPVFVRALKAGYKQAVLPGRERGLWTPFAIVGPGVKKGFALGAPIQHTQQYPTLMKLLKVPLPYEPDGSPVNELFVQ